MSMTDAERNIALFLSWLDDEQSRERDRSNCKKFNFLMEYCMQKDKVPGTPVPRTLAGFDTRPFTVANRSADPWEQPIEEGGRIGLYRAGERVLDRQGIASALHFVHYTILKHAGIRATHLMLKTGFKICNISRSQVTNFISMCMTCSQLKLTKPMEQDVPQTAIVAIGVFDIVQVDLIDFQKVGAVPFKYIAHMRDHFSKFSKLYMLPDKSGESVLRCFKLFCAEYGPPRVFQTDNGAEFTNKDLKTFLASFPACSLRHGRPHHPQTQGLVEQANGTVKRRLAAAISEQEQSTVVDWELEITRIQFSMNTAICTSTGESPFRVLYSLDPFSRGYSSLSREVAESDPFDATVATRHSAVRSAAMGRYCVSQQKMQQKFEKLRAELRADRAEKAVCGMIVGLRIPRRLRAGLPKTTTFLPCRVHQLKSGSPGFFRVATQFGVIKKVFSLRDVLRSKAIPTDPSFYRGDAMVSLKKAVQLLKVPARFAAKVHSGVRPARQPEVSVTVPDSYASFKYSRNSCAIDVFLELTRSMSKFDVFLHQLEHLAASSEAGRRLHAFTILSMGDAMNAQDDIEPVRLLLTRELKIRRGDMTHVSRMFDIWMCPASRSTRECSECMNFRSRVQRTSSSCSRIDSHVSLTTASSPTFTTSVLEALPFRDGESNSIDFGSFLRCYFSGDALPTGATCRQCSASGLGENGERVRSRVLDSKSVPQVFMVDIGVWSKGLAGTPIATFKMNDSVVLPFRDGAGPMIMMLTYDLVATVLGDGTHFRLVVRPRNQDLKLRTGVYLYDDMNGKAVWVAESFREYFDTCPAARVEVCYAVFIRRQD